jgi:hypothetical protein
VLAMPDDVEEEGEEDEEEELSESSRQVAYSGSVFDRKSRSVHCCRLHRIKNRPRGQAERER